MKKNLNISNEELMKLDYKHTHLLRKFTNENGKIIEHVLMQKGDSLLNRNGHFHTFKPLSDKFVFIENTTGPFLNHPLDLLKEFESY